VATQLRKKRVGAATTASPSSMRSTRND